MNVVADSARTDRPAKPYVSQWLESVDTLLDVHRNRFLRREPTAAELEVHKTALEFAIQTGTLLNSIVESPEVSRRLRLLSDAYAVLHDPKAIAEGERLLKEIFPE